MTLEQLAELRELLRSARNTPRNLAAIMGYFTDHVGDELDVLKLAQSTSNPFILNVLQTFTNSLFTGPVTPHLILASLPSFHFIYGPFEIENLYGTLVYFSEGLGKGLISMPSPEDPESTQVYKLFTS